MVQQFCPDRRLAGRYPPTHPPPRDPARRYAHSLPKPLRRSSRVVSFCCALLLTSGLIGCSLVGPESEQISFETLARTDTLLSGSQSSKMVVLRSDEDETAFATDYGLVAPLPDIDYETSSVVGVVYPATASGAVVLISDLRRRGDRLTACVVYDGPEPLSHADRASATAYPAHLVVTPRITGEVSAREIRSPRLGGC